MYKMAGLIKNALVGLTYVLLTSVSLGFSSSSRSTNEELTSSSCLNVIETDVVVVGAGYAGLTAARELSQLWNYSVHVLEASNATGGRTKNFCLLSMKPDVESDYVIELGGQWLGNKTVQPHSWKLSVEELGFKLFDGGYTPPQTEADPHYSVLYASNGVHKFKSLIDAFHKLPTDVQTELEYAWKQLDQMAATIDLTRPYTSPTARTWDSQTFTSWINATVKLQESRTALNILCTSMIAQSPAVVSFLHILFYIRASHGLEDMVVHEQEYRVVGGTQAPTFKMAQELGADRVLLSTPVNKITQTKGIDSCSVGSVVVEAGDGDVCVHARFAIVTGAPPTSGRGIHFSPPLPYEKSQLFQRMPMGNSVKAQIVYPTPFWRSKGLTGTILASTPPFGQPFNNPLLSNCFDNTPHAGSPGVLLCFLEGETSTQMMRWSGDKRASAIRTWLSKTFGPEANDPSLKVFLVEYNWAAQPFIGGAYSSYFTPGVWTELGNVLREPFGQIYWAGADYAEDGFGYINGAIQSASQAAKEIVKADRHCL